MLRERSLEFRPATRTPSSRTGRAADGGEGRQTELSQTPRGLRPDPRYQPGVRGAEALARLPAAEDHEPGRLLGVGGHLRNELVGADAHRAGELRGRPDLRDE